MENTKTTMEQPSISAAGQSINNHENLDVTEAPVPRSEGYPDAEKYDRSIAGG